MEGVGDSRRGAAVPCLGAAPGLGWAALGLTSLGLNCCFLWEGGGESRAGSPGWRAGGVFVCVFLYDCARNDSLGKDVFLLYLSFNKRVQWSSLCIYDAQLKVVNGNDDTVEGGGESCFFPVGITAAFIFM